MISRFKVVSILLGLAATSAHSQAPYQPQPTSPPKDAGYLLADGTVQIVGRPLFPPDAILEVAKRNVAGEFVMGPLEVISFSGAQNGVEQRR